MRVLYDITTLAHIHCAEGVNPAGIFRHVEETAVALARNGDADVRWSVASTQFRKALRYLSESDALPADRFALPSYSPTGTSTMLEAAVLSNVMDGSGMRPDLVDHLADSYSPERIYNAGSFDVFHANWRGVQELPRDAAPLVAVTVPDIIAISHPEWFVGEGERNEIAEYQTRLLSSVGAGHVVIVSSEAVKADVLGHFPSISSDQLHVVPLGVSERFARVDDASVIDAARRRYGIPDGQRYVLCVNTIEPRKNMSRVVEAFAALRGGGGFDDVTLVMVGSKGWLSDGVAQQVDEAAAGHVIMTGYVADDDLAALYSGASAFCYPSLAEGFGLPILEAMRCGLPVVTSNRSALVEAGGDAVASVDPDDTADIAHGLERILTDAEYSSDLGERGRRRAEQYTWDRSALTIVEAYGSGLSHKVVRSAAHRRDTPSLPEGATIDQLGGRFAGRRAVVVPGDVDARDVPAGVLGDEFVIGVDDLAHRFVELGWKPSINVFGELPDDPVLERETNALTGSWFFVSEPDAFRHGPDVIPFEMDADGLVEGAGLFEPGRVPAIPPADRSIAAALQIAFELGFSEVCLLGVDTSPGGAADAEDASTWHAECRQRFEQSGRTVVNLTPSTLHGVYPRADAFSVLASGVLGEFARTDKAHLDETEIIATMIPDRSDRTRVMIDVGAHRGTSAVHFVDRNWQIHCFEPDPGNRWHLEKKFGDRPNLSIDTRAVGESPADRIPFYASDESSGISGLSAFRDSHQVQGYVELTNVATILEERGIDRVDFLKIDVEGFDLSVLKGVPWDTIMPDVIECEYEDAKTLPMGHSTSDIAEFLRDKGYSVYVSEWHPIIRYGIEHQWRRVVPYPGFDVPSNSWGNLLAFRHDPGYAAVKRAFASHVEQSTTPLSWEAETPPSTATSTERPTPVKTDSTATQRASQRSVADRPRYADSADRLRSRAPALYSMLRLMRRVAARALAHPFLIVLTALFVAAVVVGAVVAPSGVSRLAVLAGGVAAALTILLVAVGVYANKTAVRLSDEMRKLDKYKSSIKRSQKAADRRQDAAVQSRLLEVESSMKTALANAANRAETMGAELATVRSEINSLRAEVKSVRAETNELDDRVRATTSRIDKIDAHLVTVQNELRTPPLYSNYANANHVRMHERWLGHEDLAHLRDHWLRLLGLSIGDRELRYMAHKICLDEDRCEGRMATSIQAAMVRSLALLSLKSERVELLEIGTLAGIAAGTLHRVGRRAQCDVSITVIDPLTGYYDAGAKDGQTGAFITAQTVRENFETLGVAPSDYRIIQRYSTDREAYQEASDRLYDYVIIDGDHSLQGVSNDYELYGRLVRPGGLLIFDDYDTEDWAAIKPFVDDHVASQPEWLWIGGEWRTGILQRRLTAEDVIGGQEDSA